MKCSPAVTSLEDAVKPGAPLVHAGSEDNISFTELIGNKEAVDAAFANAAHVVKQRFVINRITAACMEPRGAVGRYNPGDGRYTIHSPLQRAHTYRQGLAKTLNVPESKLHVTTGDVGGSFGMKTAVFNEAPLVLLAAKTHRPRREMDQHAHRGLPQRRAGARQRHRRRTGARQGRQLPGAARQDRSPPSAPICSSTCRPSSSTAARWPAPTGRRPSSSMSAPSSPIPTRSAPTAATAGRNAPS